MPGVEGRSATLSSCSASKLSARSGCRDVNLVDHLIAAGAACVGGVMNAVVGGGTLVTFPALLALGVPPVAANVTNTVALAPGYFSGAVAQRAQLAGQRERVRRFVVVAAIGGLVGGGLLLVTSDDALRKLVPVLLGLATVLLGASQRIKQRLGRGGVAADEHLADATWLPAVLGAVAVYGGFFGAGVGVMLLAVLGIGVHQPLPRSNALKQVLSFVINVTAALFFVGAGFVGEQRVQWGLAAVMAVGSVIGGQLGGRLVGRLDPDRFRWIVVAVGTVLTIVYAVRVF